MRSHFYALSLAAVVAVPVWAQQPIPTYGDPCPILYGDSYKLSYQVTDWRIILCSTTNPHSPTNVGTKEHETIPRLTAVTITELRTLIGEIRGLRAEMKDYQQQLTQAKANYDATIKANTVSQEAWQAKALNDTLESVEKIPARLALDKNLREALLTSLRDELPRDPDFIETLRQRTTPVQGD